MALRSGRAPEERTGGVKKFVVAVSAQLFAALTVGMYQEAHPMLAAASLVGVVGMLIDYAKIKEST